MTREKFLTKSSPPLNSQIRSPVIPHLMRDPVLDSRQFTLSLSKGGNDSSGVRFYRSEMQNSRMTNHRIPKSRHGVKVESILLTSRESEPFRVNLLGEPTPEVSKRCHPTFVIPSEVEESFSTESIK